MSDTTVNEAGVVGAAPSEGEAPAGGPQGAASVGQDGATASEANGKEPPKGDKKRDDAIRRTYADIARHQRELANKRMEFSRQEAELNELRALKQQLQQDPYAVAKQYGASLEEWANRTINDDGTNRPDSRELAQIKQELAAIKNAEQQKAVQSQTRALVDNYKTEMDNHISKNPSSYELTRENGGTDALFAFVEAFHQQTGRLLDPAEACDMREEMLEQELERLASLEKVKAKFRPPEPTQRPPKPFTLTNDLSSVPPNMAERTLSDDERMQRAILAYQGKLNSAGG